jgi:hypothetical protein
MYSVSIDLFLTLNLLEPKMISLCHQYRARPTYTYVQSDQALVLAAQFLYFDIKIL